MVGSDAEFVGGPDRHDAGHRAGVVDVDRVDRAVRDRRPYEDGVQRGRAEIEIGDVSPAAGQEFGVFRSCDPVAEDRSAGEVGGHDGGVREEVGHGLHSTLHSMEADPSDTARTVARRLAMPVYVPWVLVTLGRGMLLPVVPLYLRDAGLSYTLVTVVVASTGIGAVVAGLPVGRAAQRFGPEWLFVSSTLLSAVMAALLGISTAVLALVAFHLALGFGSVGLRIGVQMIVNGAVPGELRGRSSSVRSSVVYSST